MRSRRLNPPAGLLEAIDAHPHHWIEFVFPTISPEDVYYGHLVGMVYAPTTEYYRLAFQQRSDFLDNFIHAYVEALKNAMEHGNRDDSGKIVVVLLWFGQEGILCGIQDEGAFFKNSEVKAKIEAKIAFPSTRPTGTCGGLPNFLYECVDRLHVDVSDGVFYFIVRRDRDKEKRA